MVVVLEYTFFEFFPTSNKSLRLTRFRRSYVNRPAIVLINHTIYAAFLLNERCCAVQRGHVPFFCSCLPPMTVHFGNLVLLSTPVAHMLLTPKWVSKRKDVKQLPINISKLTVGIKHSISRRTTFSPNPHLVEEVTCFPSFAP